jgi:hypothetical protein
VLFNRFSEMYPANGWKRFRMHTIEPGHFLVFNYNAVSVFNESMCRRHYNAAAHYSSSDDE